MNPSRPARTSARLTWACLALATIASCRTSSPSEHGVTAQVVAPPVMPQDPMETIARYEDARRDGDGLLQALLHKGDEATRVRAATALGRLDRDDHGADVTSALVGALDDASVAVRAAAAFALGQRADPSSAPSLLSHWGDVDATVRARLVEAGSRIDDAQLRARILASLEDSDPRVRAEAALAPMRFPAGLPDAKVVDGRLVEFLARLGGVDRHAHDDAARRSALFALARRKSDRAREAFLAATKSPDAIERDFAVQGLGALAPESASARALVTALGDADWRVAYQAAVALGKSPHPEGVAGLARATEHPVPHVRRAAYEALASYGDQRSALMPLLERARVDASSNVRAAAIETGAKLLGEEAASKLALSALEKDAVVRAATAAAAAHLPSHLAVPMLDRMSRDENLRVAEAAVEGLASHTTAEARARLLELLRSDDNGLRLSAILSLKGRWTAQDAPALVECLTSTRGEIAAEVAANLIDAAAEIGGSDARDFLRRSAAYPDEYVRHKSRRVAAKLFPDWTLPRESEAIPRLAAVPIAGKDAPAWKSNPRVEVRTTRGAMVFELFPTEAPGHVFNFLALIELHHYDGLIFHRVVPDFVIQGGDHRGDGNGGVTWRGEPLRAEFTPRKFVRGSLGMPRNDDVDSGGSQFFVTHRETPHLDGRYTIFGELRSGFEVLDAIEVGDTIVSVRLLTTP